jgi:hypothetical protein
MANLPKRFASLADNRGNAMAGEVAQIDEGEEELWPTLFEDGVWAVGENDKLLRDNSQSDCRGE